MGTEEEKQTFNAKEIVKNILEMQQGDEGGQLSVNYYVTNGEFDMQK